jgi:hypothetical protein
VYARAAADFEQPQRPARGHGFVDRLAQDRLGDPRRTRDQRAVLVREREAPAAAQPRRRLEQQALVQIERFFEECENGVVRREAERARDAAAQR